MTNNVNEPLNINDLENVELVEAPTIENKKKKNMSMPTKIGIGLAGAAVVGLGVLSMMPGPAPIKAPTVNNARVSTGDTPPNMASIQPTNPEAIELLKKTEEKRAEEAKKDPTSSFTTADPFGDSKPTSTMKTADEGQVVLNAPPPPPVVQTNTSNQEDPTLAFARKIYMDATKEITPGVGVPVSVQTATNSSSSTAATTSTGTYAQQQMAAGEDADIPAGVIQYARLTSTLDSMVTQTPPRAIIVGGAYAGGILMGAMENVENKYLVLRFNTLTLGKKTYTISAIAINPDAQDAGLADEVHSRAWERAALTAGLGFVQSYGAAKLQENTTTTQYTGLSGVTTSTDTGTRTNKETALIALGGAAQSVQATAQNEIQNIKDTVKVNQNKEIGVLFMQPLYIQK